jgi:hypothetical protein
MNTDEPSSLPATFRETAKIAAIVLVIANVIAFAFMGKIFHWSTPFYSALLATPFVCMLWFRLKIVTRVRFGRLRWVDAKRLYGWSILASVSLLVFLHSLELLRGKRAFAQLKMEVEKNGRSLSWASVIPPEVPDEDNFCAIPLLASLVDVPDEASWMLGHALPHPSQELDRATRIVVTTPEIRSACWSKAELPDFELQRDAFASNRELFGTVNQTNPAPSEILRALAQFDPELEALHEAMNRPYARWNLPYDSGWFVAFKARKRDLALYNLTALLGIQSSALLAAGDPDEAESAVMLSLRLADTVRDEPIFRSFDNRYDFIQSALVPIWDGLARKRWSEESLNRIQKRLDEIRLLDEAQQRARTTALEWMTFWQGMDESFAMGNLMKHYGSLRKSDREPLFWFGLLWTLHPKGWTYQNKVHAYQWFDQNASQQLSVHEPLDPINRLWIFPKYKVATDYFTYRVPRLDRVIQQARVACALERYQLKHNAYPETLESLTPDWIAALPKSASGAPLIGYRQTSNGRYLLHPNTATKKVSEDFEPIDIRFRSLNDQDEFGDDVWRYPRPGDKG